MIGKLITGFKNLLPFLSAGLSGTLKMTAAIKLQTIALWEQAKAFLATPIGWTSAVVMVVFGLVKGLTYLAESTDRARENLSNLASEYKDNVDQIESLNEKLTTTQDRINELKAQGTLTFTEASELAQLERENAALKDKIDLLKIANQEKQKDAVATFNSLVGIRKNADGSEQMNQVETLTFYTQYQGEKYADEHIDSINKQIKALEDLEAAGVTYENADEETKNNIKRIHKLIDVYKVAKGEGVNLFSTVYNRAEWAEANKSIQELANSGNLTAESLQGLYNQGGNAKDFIDYMLSLGTIDWESILGNEEFKKLDTNADGVLYEYELFDDKTGECKVSSDKFATALGLVANELNKVEDAAESATSNIQTFSDVFKSIKEGTDVLADAYSDIEDGGEISLEHLMSLLDKYPDLVEYVNLENGQHNITIGILKAKFEAEKKAQLAKITASKSAVNAEIAEQKAILDTIATKKEKAKQDMAETMVSIGQFKTVGDALNAINARPGYYLRGFDWDVSDAKVAIADAEKQLKNLSAQEALIKKMSWEDITSGSGSSTDKNKEAAEKYFAKLKYNLETNKITEEQYLKSLDAAYKKYYGNKSKYLEEYEQYSQEVYDGFKDMYKEDLEAQKEAWEKKKDAVSEYYDNLREQIENAHDEEDYEKEQSEKRKEIFDLDMQIAELMRDGSEKAKARIAELEEERLKAEEELLDFETDKAREDELSRLEKEQESEEKKIQDKIDGIQGQLDKLDEDTVSVRNAIITYAKAKGVTLNFAYASGTRSSIGGFGRINEKGIEMISAPDGNGNYIPMLPNSYVFSAKATEFLWKLATEHSLPQAMYNSIAKSIKTQSSTPSVNIAQPITITMGDVIIKGNADKQTVADIKKQQENTVRMVLQKIKELQK